jgi:hypothetical protein
MARTNEESVDRQQINEQEQGHEQGRCSDQRQHDVSRTPRHQLGRLSRRLYPYLTQPERVSEPGRTRHVAGMSRTEPGTGYQLAVDANRNSWQADIYADTPLAAQEIAAHLAQTLRGSVAAHIVQAVHLDLDVMHHDERPATEPVDPEDAFLYFPHRIEVFTEEAFDREALVADLSAVLGAFDQLGVRYVTAAEFEDELPGGGRSRT